jgi:adenylate cyclase
MRLTIGTKLNGLLIALLTLSLAGVLVVATQLFTSDLTGLLQKGILDTSATLASRLRAELGTVAERARILGSVSLEEFKYPEDRASFIRDNLQLDEKYVALGLYRLSKDSKMTAAWRITHPNRKDLKTKAFVELDKAFPPELKTISEGKASVVLAELREEGLLRVAVPFVKTSSGRFTQFLMVDLDRKALLGALGESAVYTNSLINSEGEVLGSSDATRLPAGYSFAETDIFELMNDPTKSGGAAQYTATEREEQLGAFQRIGFGDLFVLSEVPYRRAVDARNKLYQRTGFLGGAFLFLALGFGFLLARNVTRPVQALAGAAEKVMRGDLKVRLPIRKGPLHSDEIHSFSETFNEMVDGLEERDRVKTAFNKFHSKEVVDQLLSGELKLGGERKEAVVFFSDIRSFTAMSEKLPADQLVSLLNRYMSRMVEIILRNGGIVDKYVGDAIMAVWGAPISKPDDAERAVRACIEMRQALVELNAEFERDGLPTIRIGMGLNDGEMIAGNIGSDERMEYTVIGDAVNTASRVESITKELGTDLLITESVLKLVGEKFTTEKATEIKVKGKTDELKVFRVTGYVDENGKSVTVETPFSTYEASKSDKVA